MKYYRFTGIGLLFVLILGCCYEAYPQNQIPKNFEYISPRPSSKFVNTCQQIAFRFKKSVYPYKIDQVKVLAKGSLSGEIQGNLKLANDHKTFIFKPDRPFVSNETIEVKIISTAYMSSGGIQFYFSIGSLENSKREQIVREVMVKRFPELSQSQLNLVPNQKTNFSAKNSLPEGFPEITVTEYNNPSPGYIFIAPFSYSTGSLFNIILDNYGTPVYYKKTTNGASDFKKQPSGDITYYDVPAARFFRMNPFYEIVDTISIGNGFYNDMHELRILKNGHFLLLGIDPQLVNMDTVISGGHPQAVVVGLVVQELDAEKEVVFQWRSWDHFQITDVSDYVNLTDSMIDYVHGNSIEIVSDTNLILSCRNMNEITNINRNTGEIIWRLGGKNNMFEMINFADTFCMQHSIRLMPDSVNLSLFDNGNFHNPEPYSSAIEYHIDATMMTVEMVNQIRNEPDIFTEFMGHAQRLQNGNTIIGWGYGVPSVTEYNPDGTKLLEISFPYANYRAFKVDWETTVFETNVNELNFGFISIQDSVYKTFEISNNCNYPIEINRFLTNDKVFRPLNILPVILEANEVKSIAIQFKADSLGAYNDVLTVCLDIETDTQVQRIARQVSLFGVIGNQGFSDNPKEQELLVFPNPFMESISVHSANHFIDHIIIYNHNGALIENRSTILSKKDVVHIDKPAGIYFMKVTLINGDSYTTKIIKK